MSRQEDSPLRTLYRLSVMVGMLVCGSLAAYRYGPPPDELAEMIDSVAARVAEFDEAPSGVDAIADATPAPPAIETAPSFGAAPTASSAPSPAPSRIDPSVSQAGFLQPVGRSSVATDKAGRLDRLERERLTAPLLAEGADRADVTPWGSGPTQMYRATASVAVGGAATGLRREIDAIAPTPDDAVAKLLSELRAVSLR